MKRGNPWKQLPSGPLIAPSLLAADFVRLGEQIDTLAAAGADVLHMDIMDGHFVPNLSMGPAVVRSVRRRSELPIDVHLMVTDPEHFIGPFAEAGADSMTFHIEADCDHARLIDLLHGRRLGAGITLRPGTPAAALAPVADMVDLVLVMTVEPGYGGQEFMEDMLAKVAAVRGMLSNRQRLEVDGGINPDTGGRCAAAGADVFVAGSDLLGAADIAAAVADLRRGARAGAAARRG